MKWSLEDKVAYNNKKYEQTKDHFALGYTLGVTLYQGYFKSNASTKAAIDVMVQTLGNSDPKIDPEGAKTYKGFMCGLRDAAQDRKSRKTKLS